jgi:hypothetical protein
MIHLADRVDRGEGIADGEHIVRVPQVLSAVSGTSRTSPGSQTVGMGADSGPLHGWPPKGP